MRTQISNNRQQTEKDAEIDARVLHLANHVLCLLGKRILPIYFYSHNPEEMNRWQHNICRQAHILCYMYLYLWFGKDYDLSFYESIFEETVTKSRYDHSWVFLQHKRDDSLMYLCDVARVSEHIGLKRTASNNPECFLKGSREITEERRRIDVENVYMVSNEYYTGKTVQEIFEEVTMLLYHARANPGFVHDLYNQ